MPNRDHRTRHIRDRINSLSVGNPEKYAERIIPALSNQTIGEAIKQANGEQLVAQYLARLEEILGTSGQ